MPRVCPPALILAALALSACVPDELPGTRALVSTDAAVPSDAGPDFDAAPRPDAGPPLDAGFTDAGAVPDAGFPDATVPPDAGFPDAGFPDAGVVPDAGFPDSGVVPDAGFPIDAGFPDSGVVPDAGFPDAGFPDSGVTPDAGFPDSGVTPDAGFPDSGVTPDAGVVPDAGSGGPLAATVFASGHSLLEGTPPYMASIAAGSGLSMEWERQHINGSPIRVRTKGMNPGAFGWPGYSSGANKSGGTVDVLGELAQRRSVSRPYDTLLITERHDILLTIQWENTVGYLDHYVDRVQERNPNMRTILTHVWPGIGNLDNPGPWITALRNELVIWECIASKLNLHLAAQGRSDRVGVSPGGLALANFVEDALAGRVPGITGTTRQRMQTIFVDDVHLRPEYRYLISAVQYAILFERSPVGAPAPSSLPPGVAAAMQNTAWNVVQGYTQGRAANRTMSQCRAATQSYCPTFASIWQISNPGNYCNFWNASNPNHPFRWPDPNFVTYPAPP